jgi:hypothetical protein
MKRRHSPQSSPPALAVYTLGSYAPKGHTTELQQGQEWRSVALDKGM